jgi:hypothetical protein
MVKDVQQGQRMLLVAAELGLPTEHGRTIPLADLGKPDCKTLAGKPLRP